MGDSKELVNKDSNWRQRSELEAMADLPPELEKELERLDKEFWVDDKKLKEIVKRFREELNEGTQLILLFACDGDAKVQQACRKTAPTSQ